MQIRNRLQSLVDGKRSNQERVGDINEVRTKTPATTKEISESDTALRCSHCKAENE